MDALLAAYGLDALLTPQDDPQLWQAALRQHWPAPDDPACPVEALRFRIGRRLADGEQPQGEDNQRHASLSGMVDVSEWCFERMDPAHLQVKTCPSTPPPVLAAYPGQGLAALMSGQALPAVQAIFMYLGVSRPSQEVSQALVYAASSMPGIGEGNAYLWQRQPDGRWQQTDQRLAWWIT